MCVFAFYAAGSVLLFAVAAAIADFLDLFLW
jgi:hypothetical protein